VAVTLVDQVTRLGTVAPGLLRRLPTMLTGLMLLALAWQLASLAWQVLPSSRTANAPSSASQTSAPSIDRVISAHVFGNPTGPTSGQSAPQSQVPLVVAGTLAVSDPKAGLAIVGESAAAGRLYATGGNLPGGVKLFEVYADRIVIERNGALETLYLPRSHLAAAEVLASKPAQASAAVTRVVEQSTSALGEILRPMPNYANGQLKGFRLYAGRDRERFTALGLQPGDLVTQVNGVPLGDAQHGMEVLRTLTSGGPATVTVEREGAVQQLTIDASQVSAITGVNAAPGSTRAVPAITP